MSGAPPRETRAPAGRTEPAAGIELEHDPKFQRREWMLQRLGWDLMLAVVIAAMLGVFGRGPFAAASAAVDGGRVRLEYDRLLRHRSPTPITIHLAGGVSSGGAVRVWLSREYVEGMEPQRIVPEPERMESAADGYVYTFRIADPSRRSTIVFDLEPEGYGNVAGRLRVEGGSTLRFAHFVFP